MKEICVYIEQIRFNEDVWEMEDEEFERLQKLNDLDRLKEIKKMVDPCNYCISDETLVSFFEVVR